MTRQQLEHIIRAAAANADVTDIVVIGSQSILGAYPDAPPEVLASMDADVFPRYSPERSILIDGTIGELSMFHETFGYYAHGVDETTATLPVGWEDRLIKLETQNTGSGIGWCLDPNDLAVSKLVAGRPKDLEFVSTLARHRLIDPATVLSRLAAIPNLSPSILAIAQDRLPF